MEIDECVKNNMYKYNDLVKNVWHKYWKQRLGYTRPALEHELETIFKARMDLNCSTDDELRTAITENIANHNGFTFNTPRLGKAYEEYTLHDKYPTIVSVGGYNKSKKSRKTKSRKTKSRRH